MFLEEVKNLSLNNPFKVEPAIYISPTLTSSFTLPFSIVSFFQGFFSFFSFLIFFSVVITATYVSSFSSSFLSFEEYFIVRGERGIIFNLITNLLSNFKNSFIAPPSQLILSLQI